jgi:hypothetical protein
MYVGLLLAPWLVFFGGSGLLFNHPNWGEQVSSRGLPAPRLKELTGFVPWQPQQLAERVVAGLNEHDSSRGYRVSPSFASRYSGTVVMKAPTDDGLHLLLLDPARGLGILAHRKARPAGAPAPFAGEQVTLPEYSLSALNEQFRELLATQGERASGPLVADAELAPRLELRLDDREGQAWNVTYDLANGTVAGRLAAERPPIGVSQLFAMLHTTHHFTFAVQARWFWALFEDLLGAAMAFWGVSGLVMWWQLKPTRIIGLVALALALGVAGFVFVGTARDALFGDVPQALGPGR